MKEQDKTEEQLIERMAEPESTAERCLAAKERLRLELFEYKQAEAALLESEKKYRQLIENLHEGVWVTDKDGYTTFVNPRMAEMLGYTVDEMIGKHLFSFMDEQGVKVATSKLEHSQQGIKERHDLEFVRKDGQRIYASLGASSIKDDVGNYMGTIAAVQDITEGKRVEEELRQYRGHLEGMVEKRTAELQESYEREKKLRLELEEQLRRRVEFTRALVHELKTPLTPMMAASDLLISESLQEPLLSLAKKIDRGICNLEKRINELLDLARGEIGMLKLKCQWLDLQPLFNRIVDDVAPEASKNRHSLVLDLSPSFPRMWADEDRLREVVLNLLSNALKFTPKGGRITLRAKEEDGNLIVEVQDTGCGIDEEEQRCVFQPYDCPESKREHLSGLGLGLALSKMLVELHGGKIWVKSQKGKGSVFGFSVPLEDPNKRAMG